MGLDWRGLSLSGYFEALEAHNAMQSGEKPAKEMTAEEKARLRAVMKARENG